MKASIIWFVRLGIDQSIFTKKNAWATRITLGEDIDLVDFAQYMLDEGMVSESKIEQLENIAGEAFAKGQAGPPADDPFESKGTQQTPPVFASAGTVAYAYAEELVAPTLPITRENPPQTPPKPSSSYAPEAREKPIPKIDFRSFNFDEVASWPDLVAADALRGLLVECGRAGVSDLHLSAGAIPFMREERMLRPFGRQVLSAKESLRLNTLLLAPHQRDLFLEEKDLDFALALDNQNRFRVNLMFHKGGASGSYRMIPAKVPKLDSLGLRNLDAIRKLLSYHNGLILVTGPVGAGKTTTLAALVAELNEKRHDHIITVEDPIEVVQSAIGCNITQREVGPHTRSFATALKGALREDPDVIVIGELRDLETIEMAISASETGHLVIGTMHTSDASTTLNRMLDVFPPSQQSQIRASVAESLRGIICQRLLPCVNGGLILACEILIANTAVSAIIREGKMAGLRNVLETGQREGMCLMESGVFSLYQEGLISADTARENISNRVLRGRIA